MASRYSQWVLAAILTLATSQVYAAPTISAAQDSLGHTAHHPKICTAFSHFSPDPASTEQDNPIINCFQTEPQMPPIKRVTASTLPFQTTAKSIPAGPTAILMVISGFACVSLVRDRRWWLSLVLALLCLSQAALGLSAPRRAYICRGKSITRPKEPAPIAKLIDLSSHARPARLKAKRTGPLKTFLSKYKYPQIACSLIFLQNCILDESQNPQFHKQQALGCLQLRLLLASAPRGPPTLQA